MHIIMAALGRIIQPPLTHQSHAHSCVYLRERTCSELTWETAKKAHVQFLLPLDI